MTVRLRRRLAAVLIVLAFHFLCLWIFADSMQPSVPFGSGSEIKVTVFSPRLAPPGPPAPPLSWVFQAPPDVEVPEPAIDMPPDVEGENGAQISGPGQILPPKPDPNHVNQVPELPPDLRALARRLVMQLRIWVLQDGDVGEVQVVRGSGHADIDRLAVAFVLANWRYIPASEGGRVVPDWATVYVRFPAFAG